MITLGTARASPGETDTGRLEVGETRDGSPVRLPIAVINGAADGQTLYMQAVSDGDELNGLGVVNRVVPRIDPPSCPEPFSSSASSTTSAFRSPSIETRSTIGR